MKLQAKKRDGNKKSAAKVIRRENDIPAVLYSPGNPTENITVSGSDFGSAMRQISSGHLPTTIFELEIDGKATRVIVKEIQYHPTTYDIIHLDFERLHDDVPVNVSVPIHCSSVAECLGIKLGGVLRQVIRHAKVRCLPKNIPSEFYVDVKSLGMLQSKRVADIKLPEGVQLITPAQEVAVVIAKR